MTHTTIVRSLQLLTHFLFFYGIWYIFQSDDATSYIVTSLIVYYLFGMFGINVGFHRYLSHRSFKTNSFFHYAMTIVGTLAVMGSPIGWVSVHRQHHRYSDQDGDPHSPHILGPFRTWFGFWGDFKIKEMCKDLRRDPVQKFIHNHYGKIHLFYCTILGLIDPLLIVFVYAIPAVLIFHSAGTFDVIAHIHGYRTYDTNDRSKNSWIANIVTMGEGWHNNHHANPSRWTTKEKWWEIDPSGWIVKLIKIN
jgi:stearoyl-CoA desaturase (delta-9 desaturase)